MPFATPAGFCARALLLVSFFSIGCGAAATGRELDGDTPGTSGSGGSGGGNPGVSLGGNTNVSLGGSTQGSGGDPNACATASADATLITEPVDILVVLDNSGSMAEEMDAAEKNININFASILAKGGADYRVILLSRHRQAARTANEEASTSICVSQPLSGLATCPATLPVFSDRFFQYSEKIESFDALNWILDGYSQPPENDDYRDLAPSGYSAWLRPNAKKVIIVMTDDDEANDDKDTPLTVDTFLTRVTALAPQHFGTDAANPTFTFHSIIGIKEKADPTAAYLPTEPALDQRCTGNGAAIEASGLTYQGLSIRTGGLRFPLCQFPGYDAVFRAIADDVIVKSDITCNFDMPLPPEGKTLDLDKIAVNYVKGDGSGSVKFGQAATSGACQTDAFYIENNRIFLCPETCNALQTDAHASVDVLFTCESTIIVK